MAAGLPGQNPPQALPAPGLPDASNTQCLAAQVDLIRIYNSLAEVQKVPNCTKAGHLASAQTMRANQTLDTVGFLECNDDR